MAAAYEVYAKAIFELGEEKNQSSQFLAELKELSKGFPKKSLKLVSGLDIKSRSKVVSEILSSAGVCEPIKKLVLMLAKNGRLSDLSELANELERLTNKKSGIVLGEIRSAVELGSSEIENISSSIAKRIKTKVELRNVISPDLLGGFVAKVSGRTFDCSLKSQLEKVKSLLSQ